jgi:fructoselysine-6-P-deglycase FrlB-like protein
VILGRPTNLLLGAFTAVFNVIVLVTSSSGNTFFTPEIVAAVNVAAAAVIAFVAGQPPTVTQGDKVTVITPTGEPNKVITA